MNHTIPRLKEMIDNKPFAMFFNASPRKGGNTHKMLEAAKTRALGKRLVEKARTHI